MRVLTGYSKDKALTDAFNHGKDLHCLTGEAMSNFTYDQLKAKKEDKTTEEYLVRQMAKRVNFGTVYGIGAMGLSANMWQQLRIRKTEQECQGYLDGFFSKYPGVKTYIDETQRMASVINFTPTYTGRKRRFAMASYDSKAAARMARQSINARIQTTSSDLVCYNLVDIHNYVRANGGRLLLTVHDSAVFQLPKGITGVKAAIDHIMIERTRERAPWLPVAWKYDIGKGPNYGDAHEDVE